MHLQNDVHNEIKLLTDAIWTSVLVSGQGGAKKGSHGQKLLCIKSWECKVVLPDAKSLFHTLHIKVNTTQH